MTRINTSPESDTTDSEKGFHFEMSFRRWMLLLVFVTVLMVTEGSTIIRIVLDTLTAFFRFWFTGSFAG